MESRLNPRFLTAFALAAMMGLTACDDDDNGITDPVDPEPAAIEIFDEEEPVAQEVNGTWQGGIPPLEVGQTRQFEVVVLDQDGDTIQLGTTFTVQAMLTDDSEQDIVEITNQPDSVTITGLAEGEASMMFQVLEGTTTVHESPPITVTVTAADAQPVGAQLRNRETGDLLAESEGEGEEMTWVGEMPDLPVGESLEVDVVFVNAAGNPIPLAEGETVSATIAEGESETVVTIENAGDHVVLTGAEAGDTQMFFSRMQGETEQFSTQPIGLTVVAAGG